MVPVMNEPRKPGMTQTEKFQRRMIGVRAVNAGQERAVVAEVLGVHLTTIDKWMSKWHAGGEAALAPKKVRGRPRALTPEREAEVLSWLLRQPAEFGFPSEVWTSQRIADVILEKSDVRMNAGHLRTWLRERGCAPLKPARPAKLRDEAEVAAFVGERFPALEKKSPSGAATSF
jgi:transposase